MLLVVSLIFLKNLRSIDRSWCPMCGLGESPGCIAWMSRNGRKKNHDLEGVCGHMNHSESSYSATGFIAVEYCCRQVTRDCNNVLQSASAGNHEVLSQTTTHAEQADAGGLVEIIPNQQISTDINSTFLRLIWNYGLLWTAMDWDAKSRLRMERPTTFSWPRTHSWLHATGKTQLIDQHENHHESKWIDLKIAKTFLNFKKCVEKKWDPQRKRDQEELLGHRALSTIVGFTRFEVILPGIRVYASALSTERVWPNKHNITMSRNAVGLHN